MSNPLAAFTFAGLALALAAFRQMALDRRRRAQRIGPGERTIETIHRRIADRRRFAGKTLRAMRRRNGVGRPPRAKREAAA